MSKKAQQLGMNPSTASGRLVKDILFKLVCDTGRNKCFQCGGDLTRDTFSIEHMKPWIDSENPVEMYFDLDNIAFSHYLCNVGARRTLPPSVHGTVSKYAQGCRCEECSTAKREYAREYKTKIKED